MRFVWLAWVLPVLYVLSAGPVVGLLKQSGHPPGLERFVSYFYAPLEWLYMNVRLVAQWLDWYIDFFR
ncbi:hypothetical protein DYH09_18985 [bacterium CPR1]|nr:hypothetical protein [bacterium CPR1]